MFCVWFAKSEKQVEDDWNGNHPIPTHTFQLAKWMVSVKYGIATWNREYSKCELKTLGT
jgi:hypothetical protein